MWSPLWWPSRSLPPLERDDDTTPAGRPWLRPALIGALCTLLFLLIGTVVLSVLGGSDVGGRTVGRAAPDWARGRHGR